MLFLWPARFFMGRIFLIFSPHHKFLTFLPHNLSSTNLEYLQFFIFSTAVSSTRAILWLLNAHWSFLFSLGVTSSRKSSFTHPDNVRLYCCVISSTSFLPCLGMYPIECLSVIFLFFVSPSFSKVETMFYIPLYSLILEHVECYVHVNWRNKTELSMSWNSAIFFNAYSVTWPRILIFTCVSSCSVISSVFLNKRLEKSQT